MTEKMQIIYQDNPVYYNDMKNIIDTAVEKAVKIAVMNVRIEVAEKAIIEGVNNTFISKITGLSIAEIEKIRQKIHQKINE